MTFLQRMRLAIASRIVGSDLSIMQNIRIDKGALDIPLDRPHRIQGCEFVSVPGVAVPIGAQLSVVVWDGKTLAADRQVSSNGHKYAAKKIFRISGDRLVGFVGTAARTGAMLAWLEEGADPETYPERDPEVYDGALVIHPSGRIELYETYAHPIIIEEPRHAIGSGADFALAAMYLGKNATEAVEVACALGYTCGLGVDSLQFPANAGVSHIIRI